MDDRPDVLGMPERSVEAESRAPVMHDEDDVLCQSQGIEGIPRGSLPIIVIWSEVAAHFPVVETRRVSDDFRLRASPRALRSCNQVKVFLER